MIQTLCTLALAYKSVKMLKYGIDAELQTAVPVAGETDAAPVIVAVESKASSSSSSSRRLSSSVPLLARDLLSPQRRASTATFRPPLLSLHDASAGAVSLLRAWALLCLARYASVAGIPMAGEIMLAIALAAAAPGALGVAGITAINAIWFAIAEPLLAYAASPLTEAAHGAVRALGAAGAPPVRAALRVTLRAALPRARAARLVTHKAEIAQSLKAIRQVLESRTLKALKDREERE